MAVRGRLHPRHRLTPELLLRAYAAGIFPMAESRNDPTVYWVDPEERGVLPLSAFHVSKRLRRTLRHGPFSIAYDTDFSAVIRACAELGDDERRETWINDPIVEAYGTLHEQGIAHSLECRLDGRLVGGLYGLAIGGAFFGESMFSRETDASKVALVYLVAGLARDGFTLLDVQFVTPHLRRFGAIAVPRPIYHALLAGALESPARFHPAPVSASGLMTFLQSTTPTS